MAEKSTQDQQKEWLVRVENFNAGLQELQKKYKMVMVSRSFEPIDPRNPQGPFIVHNYPIQVVPLEETQPAPTPAPSTEATKPE